MSFRVQVTAEARRQLLEIDEWWTANRPEAPDLVVREFSRALALLAMTPTAGKVYVAPTSTEFRRLLLRRSRFHVYYVVDAAARVVLIAAVWNSSRGHGPALV